MVNKSLGRGLSAFLVTESDANGNVLKINLGNIHPNPYQPRQFFDEEQLNSLADSIKRKGILQPVLVQKIGEENYQLVAGERRFRASKIAGLEEIPAIVVEFSPEEMLEIAILENIQRENLNPIEEAEGYNRLLREFNRTQEEVAEMVGKSRSHVANLLRLLDLPDDVKQLVKQGKLTFGHARALVSSENPSEVAQKIIDESLNVRNTEKLIQESKNSTDSENKKSSYVKKLGTKKNEDFENPDLLNLCQQISELSGLKTTIKLSGRGGELIMSFENFNELDKFIQKINE